MISASLNATLSTNSDIRNRPTSTNSSHCSERQKGSHSKDWDKTTPRTILPMRQNQVRICSFKQHVKGCKKEATYMAAMKALCDGSDNNPTHKETFNTLKISIM